MRLATIDRGAPGTFTQELRRTRELIYGHPQNMDTVSSLIDRSTSLHLRLLECDRLLSYATQFANKRWSPADVSFLDTRHHGEHAKHLVNSSTALITIARCPEAFPKDAINAFSFKDKDARLRKVTDFYTDPANYDFKETYWISKSLAAWSPYTTALAIHALMASAKSEEKDGRSAAMREVTLARMLIEQVQRLLAFLTKWALRDLPTELQDYDHVFFAYTAIESIEMLLNATDEGERCRVEVEVENGKKRNLNASFAGDRESEYARTKGHVLERFHLEFFRQMTFQFTKSPQYIDAATLTLSLYSITTYAGVSRRPPDDILDAALEAIFAMQHPGGFWDTGTPILGSATGLVGCSSIELANCLLRVSRVTSNFDRFVSHFDRLLNRIVKGVDPDDPANGWATEIRRNDDARQTWYSFLVFEQLTLLSEVLGKYIAELLLKSFQYRKLKPQVLWEDLADFNGYKARIQDHIINPRNNGAVLLPLACSFILFGPPGTGKTSVASALAHELKWGLVEIGPADFLANGLNGLFSQGDAIFQRLLLLERVVVLFDEIDELVSVRDSKSESFNRFVTTYMLPWLQRLRDKGTVIFIFATNHVERFDPAIKRPGRFDLVLPIGPPQGEDRLKLLLKAGVKESMAKELRDQIPPQATLGEMLSAIREFKHLSSPVEFSTCVLERLKVNRLLIPEEEWLQFEALSKQY